MKAYELAKELKITSKDLIERAKKLGIELSSHLSSLEDDQVSKIKNHILMVKKLKITARNQARKARWKIKKLDQ